MAETTTAPQTPTVPTAEITLGGRARVLRFTLKSHTALEDLTARPWYDVLAEAQLGFSRALVRLVWACLRHEPKPPSVAEIEDALDALSYDERTAVYKTVDEVVAASLPKKPEADEADAPLADEAAA
jgi:hypothetical protein